MNVILKLVICMFNVAGLHLTMSAKLRIVALNDNGLGLGVTEIKEKMTEEGISV